MNFKDSNVLITGGAGFIGSALARKLVCLGANVTIADSLIPEYGGNIYNLHGIKNSVTLNVTDVRDPHAMAYLIKGQHYLFNMAGQTSHVDSMNDPLTDLNINSASQLSILEACKLFNRDVKIVFASTRQIYGKPDYLPVDERHSIKPVDVNGINKLSGESFHLLYNNIFGIRSCVLRLTNTFGPGMRVKDSRQTFLGIWIRNIIENKPIKIFGDGLQIRDFNFVDDVVQAFLVAAASSTADGQIYNLGAPDHINLSDLASKLVALNGSGEMQIVPFPPDRKVIDIGDYYSDFSKIRKDLGWVPQVPLNEALLTTLNFYKVNQQKYWEIDK
jgi:UDP-glucose 4-epimerase